MIRRLGAALIGLALVLPLAVTSVAAHNTGGWEIRFATYDVGAVTHVVGIVTNHSSARWSNVTVTATWTAPASTETGAASVRFLAPHSSSPFHLVEDDVDVTGSPTFGVTSSVSSVVPAGGLQINENEPTGTTTITATGTVKNESSVAAGDVVVYGVLRTISGVIIDTATSASLGTVNAGATSGVYTLTFSHGTGGATVDTYAQSTSGTPYLTQWTNYFGDLVTSNFTEEIAYLADNAITLGCGTAIFCPKSSVSREQMALFLDRAIDFAGEPFGDAGFTDISGLSAEAQQAINNLAGAGVTGGCSTSPLKYCPAQAVTRGQMSKFIVIAYEVEDGLLDHFTDDTGHFSEPYNNAMFEAGITTGCTATTFCPTANVLREQMAVFIFRAEAL